MEFKSLKNIETSFRQIRLFAIVFLVLCSVVVVWSVYSSYAFAERQREKIKTSHRTVRQRHGSMCAASTNCFSRSHLRRVP